MPPKNVTTSTLKKPMRLPPLSHLRVKGANAGEKNPCLVLMSSVLTCWASNGFNVPGCQNLEMQLRQCMDTPRPKNQRKNNINYHLARLYPNMVGPRKKK